MIKEGKTYWEKITQVLPEKKFRIWKVKLFLNKQIFVDSIF